MLFVIIIEEMPSVCSQSGRLRQGGEWLGEGLEGAVLGKELGKLPAGS